jgi:hypothetical protein
LSEGRRRSWLVDEISTKQISVNFQPSLGNVYGTPPPIIIKTNLGDVRIEANSGPFMLSHGQAIHNFKGHIETLSLGDNGWRIVQESKTTIVPMTKESFESMLVKLLKK